MPCVLVSYEDGSSETAPKEMYSCSRVRTAASFSVTVSVLAYVMGVGVVRKGSVIPSVM